MNLQATTTKQRKTTQLRALFQRSELAFLMEAHNGLSARLVEETGFSGIWASGLAISASMGVRDNNEASWTQVVDTLEFMSDATSIPILLDGDTGYGNFNNVRRLIKKLEQRDIAGVCLEDKLFPKTNSFLNGEQQELADVSEFCGKIKAAKDTQSDPDFSVVARIESFIVGMGLNEALDRAYAYANAGADAILVHSKKAVPDDIVAFMQAWDSPVPIVIVPTKYYATPTDQFRTMGISTVIWANHSIRSAMTAMKTTMKTIYDTETLKDVEPKISSVSDIFRIQGADELAEAETQYLPGYNTQLAGIILAAGPSRIDGFSGPKSMLLVHGRSILDHQVDHLERFGIGHVTVVRGHDKAQMVSDRVSFVDNDAYATTSEVYSLALLADQLDTAAVISYGDVVYKHYFIHECLAHSGDVVIVVDVNCPATDSWRDYVQASEAFDALRIQQSPTLIQMARSISADQISGEFVGLMKTTKTGSRAIQAALRSIESSTLARMTMPEFLTALGQTIPVHIVYVQGGWVDVNTLSDWTAAADV
ncbi:MAG: phosphoenolpyruvate mutase [Candidatus Marinamargulisbacteria bacterium]|nr:phosphoenolpyruvate mutase [Candidatus Marinamargulisbacteria bacterium]